MNKEETLQKTRDAMIKCFSETVLNNTVEDLKTMLAQVFETGLDSGYKLYEQVNFKNDEK